MKRSIRVVDETVIEENDDSHPKKRKIQKLTLSSLALASVSGVLHLTALCVIAATWCGPAKDLDGYRQHFWLSASAGIFVICVFPSIVLTAIVRYRLKNDSHWLGNFQVRKHC